MGNIILFIVGPGQVGGRYSLPATVAGAGEIIRMSMIVQGNNCSRYCCLEAFLVHCQ